MGRAIHSMRPLNYFTLIHRYIAPQSPVYQVYLPHVTLVTAKALAIARRLGLPPERQRFIEEASMLHDIGIVGVAEYSTSSKPYICHAPIGREILEREGLPAHALVAERHIGLGLSKQEILEHQLPVPPRDMLPKSLEEQIICWADLFFGKNPKTVWIEKSLADVQRKVARYGHRQEQQFAAWQAQFDCHPA
ncbi:HD domain-containing protein [candidate division KSB3 bacterium]|uniref:HD domain-containing protein n=1 Tax=candidate division KSB3 bacterium TaxID=2044937 RepID=A0A9D5Q6B3_9BACT|nr:HD domain-containing protein [candidate division KSB3 bacterium]MBD3325545.1 HD domain-containing protein [candidate division KSB3 bacterium]